MHIGIAIHATVITSSDYRMHRCPFVNPGSNISGNHSTNAAACNRTAKPIVCNISYNNIRIMSTGMNTAINLNIDITCHITVARATINILDISVHFNINITLDMPPNTTTYYRSTI